MPVGLTWDHPDADPAADIIAMMNLSRPEQPMVVRLPPALYQTLGPEVIADQIYEATGLTVRIVTEMNINPYSEGEDDGG